MSTTTTTTTTPFVNDNMLNVIFTPLLASIVQDPKNKQRRMWWSLQYAVDDTYSLSFELCSYREHSSQCAQIDVTFGPTSELFCMALSVLVFLSDTSSPRFKLRSLSLESGLFSSQFGSFDDVVRHLSHLSLYSSLYILSSPTFEQDEQDEEEE